MRVSDIQYTSIQNSIQDSASSTVKESAKESALANTGVTKVQPASTVGIQIDLFDLQPRTSAIYTKEQVSSSFSEGVSKPVSRVNLEDFSVSGLIKSEDISSMHGVSPVISVPSDTNSSSNVNRINGQSYPEIPRNSVISDEMVDQFLKNAFKVFNSEV